MAGYATMAQIDRAAPRVLIRPPAPIGPDPLSGGAPLDELAARGDATVEDVGPRPPGGPISDLWDEIREVWGQAMYVLNDPHGGR